MGSIDRSRWQLLEPLLDHALDLTAQDRGSWLETVRVRSPQRAAELEMLLSGEGVADQRGFLNDAPGGAPAGIGLGTSQVSDDAVGMRHTRRGGKTSVVVGTR
jgi:hypothetical protein